MQPAASVVFSTTQRAHHLVPHATLPITRKSLLHPQPIRVGTHHPTYENGFFTPELSKTEHITP
jgi:hypothetical protein